MGVYLTAMAAQAAPGQLELVRGFVNTADVEYGEDRIAAPERLRAWMGEHELPGADGPLVEADVQKAQVVREALRKLLLHNNGDVLDPNAMHVLNDCAAACSLVVRFDEAGRTEMRPAGGGVNAAIGRLLAIVDDAMVDGTWRRLKACRASDCQWAFYDTSKNRSATWCSMELCGNRLKTKRYRSKRAAAAH